VTLREICEAAIIECLVKHHGSRKLTAIELDISPRSLTNWINAIRAKGVYVP